MRYAQGRKKMFCSKGAADVDVTDRLSWRAKPVLCRGSGGMPPRGNFCFLGAQRLILVHSEPFPLHCTEVDFMRLFVKQVHSGESTFGKFSARASSSRLLGLESQRHRHYLRLAAVSRQLVQCSHACTSHRRFLRWVLVNFCTTKGGTLNQ